MALNESQKKPKTDNLPVALQSFPVQSVSLPTLLTLLRILLIPIMVIFAILPEALWARVVAAAVFFIAALTDALDGYLARRWQQTTPFGAFLDPVADKLLVATALVVLVYRYEGLLITLPALVIVNREIIVSALREWMAELRKHDRVATSALAKWKTGLQMTSIVLLLAGTSDSTGLIGFVVWVGYLMLYLAAILTIWSMINYLRGAWSEFLASIQYKPPVKEESPQESTHYPG